MKKLQKKVVIATSVGLASMILNAACGYGPPVEQAVDTDATYGVSSTAVAGDSSDTQDSSDAQDSSTEDVTGETNNDDRIDLANPVYGPPPAGR